MYNLELDVHMSIPTVLTRLHQVKQELNEAIENAQENRKQEFDAKMQQAHDSDDLKKVKTLKQIQKHDMKIATHRMFWRV